MAHDYFILLAVIMPMVKHCWKESGVSCPLMPTNRVYFRVCFLHLGVMISREEVKKYCFSFSSHHFHSREYSHSLVCIASVEEKKLRYTPLLKSNVTDRYFSKIT